MIDNTTLEEQMARKRAWAKANYAANWDKILAKKRIRDHSRTRSAAAEKAMQDRRRAQVYVRPEHFCLECGETIPEGHRPVDFCCWRHYEIRFQRTYHARVVPFLPPCERQRR